MSKKFKKPIAPPVYTGALVKPVPQSERAPVSTSSQAEGWICKAAIQHVQGAGAMRDYIRLEDLCTVQCEEPDPGCHRVRVTVERM